jgi:hypothetical protein
MDAVVSAAELNPAGTALGVGAVATDYAYPQCKDFF